MCDFASVSGQNREGGPVGVQRLTHRRNEAQFGKDEPRHRFVVGFFRQVQPHRVVEVFDVHPPVNLCRPLVDTLNQRRFGMVVLVGNLPDNLLKQILNRYQPRRSTVLVQHDRHVHLAGLELPQKIVQQFRFRYEKRFSHNGPQIGPVRPFDRQQVLGVKDTDDIVDVAGINGYSRMPCLNDRPPNLLQRGIGRQSDDVGPGRDYLAGLTIAELDYRFDHLHLFGIDGPFCLSVGGDLQYLGLDCRLKTRHFNISRAVSGAVLLRVGYAAESANRHVESGHHRYDGP